jgi:hypothetical protein
MGIGKVSSTVTFEVGEIAHGSTLLKRGYGDEEEIRG